MTKPDPPVHTPPHEPAGHGAEAMPCRVVIIGTSGSGKSTLARSLAIRLGADHIELDSLQHGPNWTQTPVEVFRARVAELARQRSWVFDGNYIDKVSQMLWPAADMIVWLDLPLRVIVPRVVRRSLSRILRRTELWHGNREGWSALIGPNSMVVWAVRSHRQRDKLTARLVTSGTRVVRLRSSAEANRWLATIPALRD